MSSYFDFHFHPVFKQYITKFENDYPTKRTANELHKEMDLKNDLLDLVDEVILHILESQSCLDQMKTGRVKLGVANIASMELGIADSEGFVAKILRSNLTRPMDPKFINSIRKGELSYYRLFLKELDLYRKLNNNSSITFLSRKLPENFKEEATSLVLGMEGGHNLSRKKVGTEIADRVDAIQDADVAYHDLVMNSDANVVTSLQNLQQALWDENLDLFYITLTHLTFIAEQHLATHAFGLKLLKHDAFYPIGNGISQEGKRVIDAAYTMKVLQNDQTISTPIFIDIKHMSLKSRIDFYTHRKKNNYNIPIIASHMGVTGYSIDAWKEVLRSSKLLNLGSVKSIEIMTDRKEAGEWGLINKNFTFNPWTINLMDEDIYEIIESLGLIGLSLDVRILGFQAMIGMSSKNQSEYLSPEDFKTFFPGVMLEALTTESIEGTESLDSWITPTKEERHPLCMCFNILHIVSVGKITTSKDPWKHICIGSDFDGLIDPVKICRDSSKMPQLENELLRWLPIAEEAYISQNGGPKLLPHNAQGEVDMKGLKENVRNLMYLNGKAFIKKWLTKS
jgi:hypothetical protein